MLIDGDYVRQTLVRLVRINSVNPTLAPGAPGEAEIARFIAASLASLGLKTETFEPEPGRISGGGPLPACVAAAKALVDAGAQLRGDVLVAAVADEEYGSLGTSDLIRHIKVDGAIVTEPARPARSFPPKSHSLDAGGDAA